MDRSISGGRIVMMVSLIFLCLTAVVLCGGGDALAQAKNPFNVGISEGGGAPQGGFTGWVFAQQIAFERMLSSAVRAIKTDGQAVWALLGISFAYGVFHAAGPGHGKAVVASYMIANEQALKRGVMISFLAAMLQGIVAVAIVGILAWLLNATAQRMKSVANLVEVASFAGIALLGIWLVWRKGGALISALRETREAKHARHDHEHSPAHDHEHAHDAKKPELALAQADHDHAGHGHNHHDHAGHDHGRHDHFGHLHSAHDHAKHGHAHEAHEHEAHEHVHDEHCGHFHAPDPKTLGDNFSWGTALATVVTAGARPCSGAILVLVFALAQGIFLAGVAAAFAMALGTALTTGALAALAVLAKSVAVRFTGQSGTRGVIFVKALEFAAAAAVFLMGAALFLGSVHTV